MWNCVIIANDSSQMFVLFLLAQVWPYIKMSNKKVKSYRIRIFIVWIRRGTTRSCWYLIWLQNRNKLIISSNAYNYTSTWEIRIKMIIYRLSEKQTCRCFLIKISSPQAIVIITINKFVFQINIKPLSTWSLFENFFNNDIKRLYLKLQTDNRLCEKFCWKQEDLHTSSLIAVVTSIV